MLFFSYTGECREKKQTRAQSVDGAVLAQVMAYAEELEPLRKPYTIRMALAAEGRSIAAADAVDAGDARYLLIFAGDDRYGYLNGGYAAGQLAAYLRFLGFSAAIWKNPRPWMQREAQAGERCVAAVAFGTKETHTGLAERSCISHENRADWAESVTALAKKEFSAPLGTVRIANGKNCIHLEKRKLPGGRTSLTELEAGIATAHIMAAAEELWVDLVPVVADGDECLVRLCRRRELAQVMEAERARADRRSPVQAAKAYGQA